MFQKVLVANRGEIAVRVQQSLQAMGVRTVALYSAPDRTAPHVTMADEAYPLPGSSAQETYLQIGKVIDIARKAGAKAVHPGYGFLSENAAFAAACREAGLTFIGPSAEVIALLGDKARAKEVAAKAGVPVGASVRVEQRDGVPLERAARDLGFPLAAKAVAGGGGRGLRVVERPDHLTEEVAAASSEALAAFGDGRVFLERWIPEARHVEVQVLGDHHGGAVHLFERECSIQRRHQKLMEETPSPAVDDAMRAALTEAALKVAHAVGYQNAGTVEFLVAPDGRFFFLEVNTRLQVEHPITEAVLGLDLVWEQVRVAAGEPLRPQLHHLKPRGHAIECRVYAEDPYNQFAPSEGTLLRWRPPSGLRVRVDSGVREGQEVTSFYDSLLAKVTTWGDDRTEALARMEQALRRLIVLGVPTTAPFLRDVLSHPDFVAGRYHTRFLDSHPELFERRHAKALADVAAALGAWGASHPTEGAQAPEAGAAPERAGPWTAGGPWRIA